jgi:hypothetical protein
VIDSETQTTDTNGEVTTSLSVNDQHSIATGLDAIAFDTIVDTGAGLASRNPVWIDASRLVRSYQTPCRVLVAGNRNLFFSTFNEADRPLSVALTYQSLNSLLSVTGEATPAEIFAPGAGGFLIPESPFLSPEGLTGAWNFLGETIPVPTEPEICADTGVPGECAVVTDAELLRPFDYTRRAIIRLARDATRTLRTGTRSTGSTTFSKILLRRGAAVLARMQREILRSKGERFLCDVAPVSCTSIRISEAKLVKAFASLFEVEFPRELKHLRRRKAQEVKDFRRFMAGVPKEYIVCD